MTFGFLTTVESPNHGIFGGYLVVDPAGRRTTLVIDERTPFYEPYSGTSYLYLARLSQSARTGTYQVIVTGRDATKVPVVIGVGYREVPGEVRD